MNPNIKMVVFDLNGTLIDEHSWPRMNQALGMTEQEDVLLWQLNQEGIIPNKLWTEIVNNLYQKRGKATKENISKAVLDYTYNPGAKEIVEYLRPKYKIAVLSGAPDLLVEAVAHDLNIDLFDSNAHLRFDQNGLLEEMIVINEEHLAKAMQLEEFCRRLHIAPEQVACIGDGANDVEIFRMTKHGITFPGSKIEHEAWKVVGDLAGVQAIL